MTSAIHTQGVEAAASAPWGIRLDGVTVRYPNGTVGLRGVDLEIAPGEMVCIVGLSGSGKSTLIRTINGLVPVTEGAVTVGGRRVDTARGARLRGLRGQIGMVFQGFNLAGRTTVLNNVLVGRLTHTPRWRTLVGAYRDADKQIAFEALDRVGILSKVWERASALSGGQQQRVAIARALATAPDLVFADEPTGNLDSRSSREVLALLAAASRDQGQSIAMVTHDPVAASHADRVLFLGDGRIVADKPRQSAEQVSAFMLAAEVAS